MRKFCPAKFGAGWRTVNQRQLTVLGDVVCELRIHEPDDIARCHSLGSAISRAMLNAGLDDSGLAQQVNKSRGYINNICRDKRDCPGNLLLDICNATHSAAPLQWLSFELGLELYADEDKIRRARHVREIRKIDEKRAA